MGSYWLVMLEDRLRTGVKSVFNSFDLFGWKGWLVLASRTTARGFIDGEQVERIE